MGFMFWHLMTKLSSPLCPWKPGKKGGRGEGRGIEGRGERIEGRG